MYTPQFAFPTPGHEAVAQVAADFFRALPEVDTVLVANSCARGQATPESDLDLAVLLQPGGTPSEAAALEARWFDWSATHPTVADFNGSGRFAKVHLGVFTEHFVSEPWDDGGGPDSYEVEIGNRLVYAAPLGEVGAHFQALRAEWLPFYGEAQRAARLAMVADACRYDLDHVPFFVGRALHFQAFDRLYKAFQEFLQALFIAHRTYPIAYNKWIRFQVAELLGLPELYAQLPAVLSISQLESDELTGKAALLGELLDGWVMPHQGAA